MSTLKFKNYVIDAITFEWRRCFFAEGYFQKYLQALCKYIEKCSAEIAE